MYRNGTYNGISEDEAVDTCKDMYRILTDAGIKVMRVGLKSTDLVTNSSDLGGNYHPAFRQLVEGQIAKEDMLKEIEKLPENTNSITFSASPKSFSNMIGHKGINKKYFEEKFPNIKKWTKPLQTVIMLLRKQYDIHCKEVVYMILFNLVKLLKINGGKDI